MVSLRRYSERAIRTQIPVIPAWWTIFSVWHCVAVLLLVRRFTGALVQPLPGFGLITVAVLIVVISGVIRFGASRIRLPVNELAHRSFLVAPTIAGLLMMIAVTLPNSPLFP